MRPAAATFALVLAAAIPLSAQAHVIERTKITGHTAFATWEYQEGDVSTFVQVNVTNNTVKDINGKFVDAFAVLSIFRSNVVTGDLVLVGTAELTPSEFTFTVDGSTDPSQSSPRATATLVANDVIFQSSEFQFFSTDINLTWTATGPDESIVVKDKFKDEEGFYLKSTFRGAVRAATATGTVIVEGFGNFTPIPSTTGEISYANSGSLLVKTGNDAP
jgi:hypothetical protein